jgi:hypothetical protein
LEKQRLSRALYDVADACFDEVPDYQCLSGPDGLNNNVLTVARGADGRILGFASALLLDVEGLKAPVLHLGLTCVHPDARGLRLTHRLASQLAVKYLIHSNPLGKIWLSNVACVLSSVGNVAMNFDDVYPSPFVHKPSETHLRIARAISARYRTDIYIHEGAPLDEETFVFRGSVGGTMFQKDADDTRYHHRETKLNDYYQQVMNFDDGDEVVQIGHYSLATFLRYAANGLLRRKRRIPDTEPPRSTIVINRAA